MSIMIIGITGPSGSGKTLLSEYLQSHGIECIDADAVYHSLLVPPSPCLTRIAEVFGSEVLNEDGSLNRQRLSSIVFQAPEKLSLLNHTVLPIVIDTIRGMIQEKEEKGIKHVAVDAPTLIESGFYKECHYIVTVFASEDARIRRIVQRDGISREKAGERVHAQKPLPFYTAVSDFVLENNDDKISFARQSEGLLQQILAWSQSNE